MDNSNRDDQPQKGLLLDDKTNRPGRALAFRLHFAAEVPRAPINLAGCVLNPVCRPYFACSFRLATSRLNATGS